MTLKGLEQDLKKIGASGHAGLPVAATLIFACEGHLGSRRVAEILSAINRGVMTEHPTTRLQSFDEPAFDALRRTDLVAFVVTLADSRILAATPPCELLGLREDTPAPLPVKAVTRVMGGAMGHPPRLERIRLPNAFVPRLFSCATLPSRLGPVVLFVEPVPDTTPAPPESAPAPLPLARPTRFTWEMDETNRVTAISYAGPSMVPALDQWVGKTPSELELKGSLQSAAPTLEALEKGATFANVNLLTGGSHSARVEIGGVPLFDAMRRRIGWRGFGLLWPAIGISETHSSQAASEGLAPNVVPLRGGTLSPRERSAFDEIARTLSDAIEGWPKSEQAFSSEQESETSIGREAPPPVAGGADADVSSSEDFEKPTKGDADIPPPHSTDAPPLSWDDHLLDRLPVGLAVQQDGAIVFLNETLLAWLALEDVTAFERSGGFGTLLSREAPNAPLRLRTLSGLSEVDVRLIRATWRGRPAVIHVLRLLEAENRPAPAPEVNDEAALQAALDLFGFPLIVVNAAGTLLQVNAAAAALCGFRPDELAGEPFTLLFALESQKSAVALLDAALAGTENLLPETLIARSRSGDLRSVEATVSRVGSPPPSVCIALRAVSEPPARTASPVTHPAILSLDPPEVTGDAFSDFARRVSHGVRSPLTGILGFVESVRASAFGPLGNSRYSRQAEAAALAAQQLMATLEDIEAISGSLAQEPPRHMEIATTVRDALNALAPSVKRRRQVVRSDMDEAALSIMNGDVLAFLVRSVIEEAVRATPVGGQVHISLGGVEGKAPCLCIRDGGPVLSEPQIAQALSPFIPAPVADRFGSSGRPFRMARLAAVLKANGGEMRLRPGGESGMLCELHLPG